MSFASAPTQLQDPRCQPGAFISGYKQLFEVVDTRISGSSFLSQQCWAMLENVRDFSRRECKVEMIHSDFTLVRAADPVPNHPPA